jgi:hypothetical protein
MKSKRTGRAGVFRVKMREWEESDDECGMEEEASKA